MNMEDCKEADVYHVDCCSFNLISSSPDMEADDSAVAHVKAWL